MGGGCNLFNNLSENEYLEYCKSFEGKAAAATHRLLAGGILGTLLEEAIKYCEQDCISLYQVMSKFNDLMFEEFSINMNKYPTISSLSMVYLDPPLAATGCIILKILK